MKFSERSISKLDTCHPELQLLFKEVIKYVDCTIIEGYRDIATQTEYVRTGRSKTMNSKHLMQSDGYSHAVDVIAYPIDWENWHRNFMFVGYVRGIADQLGIKVRSGGDWNMDFETKDHSWLDLPHWELVE